MNQQNNPANYENILFRSKKNNYIYSYGTNIHI